jgi:hypothetical protein
LPLFFSLEVIRPRAPEGVAQLLSSFPSVTFEWTMALEELASNSSDGLRIQVRFSFCRLQYQSFSCLNLQAGTILMLTAFVSVDAHYDVDSVGIRKLIGWETSVIKTSAAVNMLPLQLSDDFHVRLSVRIKDKSPSIQRKPEVSLRQIAIAVGGASFGFILLGLLLLRIFQQMYLPPGSYFHGCL